MGATETMHDSGEESWPNRLHVCCGGVYLRGYVNTDLYGTPANGVEPAHATDIGDYYAGLPGSVESIPASRPPVVDAYADMRGLDTVCRPGLASKIVAVQCLEHLTAHDAAVALAHWHAMLRPGGVCIVSVPDALETLEWLCDPERHAFAIRHLVGTHKDERFWHRSFWSMDRLAAAMRAAGFSVTALPNFHFYPAAVCKGIKL